MLTNNDSDGQARSSTVNFLFVVMQPQIPQSAIYLLSTPLWSPGPTQPNPQNVSNAFKLSIVSLFLLRDVSMHPMKHNELSIANWGTCVLWEHVSHVTVTSFGLGSLSTPTSRLVVWGLTNVQTDVGSTLIYPSICRSSLRHSWMNYFMTQRLSYVY